MIGVYDVLTWLKRQPLYTELFRHGYCGKLDNKPEKALGVYPCKRGGEPYRAYGGLESYDIVGVSLLIHYTRNVEQAQYAAKKLFDYLRTPFLTEDMALIIDVLLDALYPDDNLYPCSVLYPNIDTEKVCRIKYIHLTVPEPVFVGTDDSGIFEFVIEFELYVNKGE